MRRPLALFLSAASLVMPFQGDESPVSARGRAKSEEWLARDKAARGSADSRNRLTREIEEFIAAHSDEEWAYAAAAFTYNWLSRNPAAMAVMRRYRNKFPASTSIDRDIEFFYLNFGTLADLRSLPDRFRRKPGYWTSLLSRAKKAGERGETLLEAARNALELMTEATDADGSSRAALAEQLLREGLDARLAERAARSALNMGETMRPMDHLLLTLPKEIIEKSLRMMNYPVYRSSLAWALAGQGRVPEALAELHRAAKLVEEKHLRTYHVFLRKGQLLARSGKPADAFNAFVLEIATGGDAPAARKAIGELPDTVREERAGLAVRVNDAAAAWAGGDPNRQDVEDVDEPLGRFDLARVDGKPFDVTVFKGKIVIIDFWASWCMSCRPSLESSNRLQREFPGDIVVVAPAGDALETQNKAAQFLAGREYRFIHVIDDPERRALTTLWIPARVALDRSGRIRIKEAGATGIGIAQFEKSVRALLVR